MEEIGRCELCASRMGLELHHIIPASFGGPDEDDNLILVCRGCHAKLTPRSILAKAGIKRACNKVYAGSYEFYTRIGEELEYGHLSAVDVMDIFDEVAKPLTN